MKKILLAFGLCAIIAACSSSNSDNNSNSTGGNVSATAQQPGADTNANKTGASSGSGSAGKGEELINKSDCMTCHKVDVKLLGPAYEEVAAKYEDNDDNIEMLATKIIQGGAGNWGDIPMSPHANVSEDDAKEMVKYILSLKK